MEIPLEKPKWKKKTIPKTCSWELSDPTFGSEYLYINSESFGMASESFSSYFGLKLRAGYITHTCRKIGGTSGTSSFLFLPDRSRWHQKNGALPNNLRHRRFHEIKTSKPPTQIGYLHPPQTNPDPTTGCFLFKKKRVFLTVKSPHF